MLMMNIKHILYCKYVDQYTKKEIKMDIPYLCGTIGISGKAILTLKDSIPVSMSLGSVTPALLPDFMELHIDPI
jgi:hypothetical protein